MFDAATVVSCAYTALRATAACMPSAQRRCQLPSSASSEQQVKRLRGYAQPAERTRGAEARKATARQRSSLLRGLRKLSLVVCAEGVCLFSWRLR